MRNFTLTHDNEKVSVDIAGWGLYVTTQARFDSNYGFVSERTIDERIREVHEGYPDREANAQDLIDLPYAAKFVCYCEWY